MYWRRLFKAFEISASVGVQPSSSNVSVIARLGDSADNHASIAALFAMSCRVAIVHASHSPPPGPRSSRGRSGLARVERAVDSSVNVVVDRPAGGTGSPDGLPNSAVLAIRSNVPSGFATARLPVVYGGAPDVAAMASTLHRLSVQE